MKKCLSILLAAVMLFSMLAACAASAETPDATAAAVTEPAAATAPTDPAATAAPTEPEKKEPIAPLEVVRQLPEVQAESGIEPYASFYWDEKHIAADLSGNPELAYSLTFSDKATFEKMPAGYNPKTLLEWGKSPGLNVDILHKHGFTGEGAVIAYVDQTISTHEQYNTDKVHHTKLSVDRTTMHGPAVLSLLSGKDIGTAPEAEVYYYSHNAAFADQTTHAQCLYQIIEQNKTLPDGEKISMVAFSDNPDPNEKNIEAFYAAIQACEDAGIMVWFCGEYAPATFLPMSDKNNPANLVEGNWWDSFVSSLIFVPSAGRTTAAEGGGDAYIYWAQGGLSWTMPYMLGLYAIANEINPALTQDDLRNLITETAYVSSGMKIINPVGFVAKVLQDVGRDAEAQIMLDEAAARSRYLYAIMDTAAMSEADLTAVSSYLASITDATVLVADAAFFSSAGELYTSLQADAAARGGKIAGVQIFGTPDMVPAFEVRYKVQMIDGAVDDGGFFLSDLFYGNFENDPTIISNGYNVMDHFAEGWNVDLVPQWPVARLPLSRDEFSTFFEKYNSFLKTTGLQQPDLVNFSNPIFAQRTHSDDMGTFLKRIDREFGLLDIPYRLYGNKIGQYPVTTATHGGFTAEELAAENAIGIAEFLINSHGQWNNIDKCYFETGEEIRESLVNMDTINEVLYDHPYYLDCWTCQNGENMKNNLTTTALNGNCVGMFAASTIISNNGVNCQASLSEMARSNFYYFYYQYLKALHEEKNRSAAFFTAQAAYAAALIEDSANGIRNGEGNYQFNLCNLLAYHNFGIIEPNHASTAFVASGYIAQAGQSAPKQTHTASKQSPNGVSWEIHDITMQELESGKLRFTIEFTAPAGTTATITSKRGAPLYTHPVTGAVQTITYEIPQKRLKELIRGLDMQITTPEGVFSNPENIYPLKTK